MRRQPALLACGNAFANPPRLVAQQTRHLGRRLQQLRQQFIAHDLRRGAVGLAADVDGGYDLAACVADGGGDRGGAFFQLLVQQAPALAAYFVNRSNQCRVVLHGKAGELAALAGV